MPQPFECKLKPALFQLNLVSACGEKSSPSPWSSTPGEEITSADSGVAVDRVRRSTIDRVSRWAIDRAQRRDRRSSDQHPNAIPSPGGEGQDEGELPAPQAVMFLSGGRSAGQGKSNLVQVKHFHRGGAEAPRKFRVGEDTAERVEMPCGARRADSRLGGLAAWRDESGIFGANRSESNQVQAVAFFLAGAGVGARTCTGRRPISPAERGRFSH